MPRPSDSRSASDIERDMVGKLNVYLNNDSESVAGLTISIAKLKVVKTDLTKLIKKLTELRDIKILEDEKSGKETRKMRIKI